MMRIESIDGKFSVAETYGTDFLLAIPNSYKGGSMYVEVFSIFNTEVYVTYSPSLNIPQQITQFNVQANTSYEYEIAGELMNDFGYKGYTDENTGIHFQSRQDISILFYLEGKSEGNRIYPISDITNYYPISSYQFEEAFCITALYDNTGVYVHWSGFIGNPDSYILKSLEVICFNAKKYSFSPSISGTVVTANNYISVFTGSPCATITTNFLNYDCSFFFTQVLPVSTWGSECIVPSIPINTNFILSILSFYNNTQISVNEQLITLNAGDQNIQHLSSSNYVLQSNNPFLLYQYQYTWFVAQNQNSNAALMRIPSINEYYSAFVVIIPEWVSQYTNFIEVISQTNDIPNLRYDGIENLNNLVWNEITGISPSYSATTMQVSNGTHMIYSTSGSKFIVFQFSFSYRDSINFPVLELESQCPGADQNVDYNHDSYPDCVFPPSIFELVDPSWKCGADSVFYCNSNSMTTKCDIFDTVRHQLFNPTNGIYFGPCNSPP